MWIINCHYYLTLLLQEDLEEYKKEKEYIYISFYVINYKNVERMYYTNEYDLGMITHNGRMHNGRAELVFCCANFLQW